jgi:predicted nucleic acid-binding protein
VIKTVFFDTSAIVALFDRTDEHHHEANKLMDVVKKNKISLLMSDYIFDESITIALTRIEHETAVRVGEFILGSKIVSLVWLDEPVKLKAWEFFKKHSDKGYSFTDCTSFVLMKEREVKHYFAFDEDFKKAGFVELC